MKKMIDNTLIKICSQYHCYLSQSVVHISDMIPHLPYKMYMLRRGQLIGSTLQDIDGIFNLRMLFLRLNFDNSLSILDPILSQYFPENYNENDVIEFKQIPCETLALHPKSILYFNCFSEIQIWIGREIDYTKYRDVIDKCIASALSLDYQYPYPSIYVFHEGTSLSRRLLCNLIPSHKDPIELQKLSFDYINKMTDIEYRMFMSKLLRTNEYSYREYLYKIFRESGNK